MAMKRFTNLAAGFALVACLALPLAFAQSGLPPEARAQIAVGRIEDAVKARDDAGALRQMQEMAAQGLPRPPTILILEARLAGQARDYPRAMAALEAYFKAAKPDDPNYAEAGRLYPIVERFLEDAKRAAKAADDAAWARASAVNGCAALLDYYGQAKTPAAYRAEALQRLQAQACPNLPAVLTPASQSAPVLTAGATPAPLTMFRDCETCPDMIALPGGSFTMGSPWNEPEHGAGEAPQRMVRVAAFAVGRFEVTFDEWAACVAGGGCASNPGPDDRGWGRGRRPVINVSWNDAQDYVQWLSQTTGQRYRLLTEAEWEYAARAGTSTAFWWGDAVRPEQAQYQWGWAYNNGSKRENGPQSTAVVGAFQANPFGLFDVHGNVWEWVEDCYNESLTNTPTNGAANTTGSCTNRVIRGGSWLDIPQFLRSASRNWNTPSYRISNLGFRLSRTL